MPLFGSRMVCETANYKYIEKRDKKFAKRENVLRRYVKHPYDKLTGCLFVYMSDCT